MGKSEYGLIIMLLLFIVFFSFITGFTEGQRDTAISADKILAGFNGEKVRVCNDIGMCRTVGHIVVGEFGITAELSRDIVCGYDIQRRDLYVFD